MRDDSSFESWDDLREWLGDREEAVAYVVKYGCSPEKRIIRQASGTLVSYANYPTDVALQERHENFYDQPPGGFPLFANYWFAHALHCKRNIKK